MEAWSTTRFHRVADDDDEIVGVCRDVADGDDDSRDSILSAVWLVV